MLIKALNSPNKVTAQEQSDQKGNCKPWNWSGTTSLHAESAGQHSCGSQPPSRDVNTLRPRRPQANLSHWVRATWTDLEIAILRGASRRERRRAQAFADAWDLKAGHGGSRATDTGTKLEFLGVRGKGQPGRLVLTYALYCIWKEWLLTITLGRRELFSALCRGLYGKRICKRRRPTLLTAETKTTL